MTLSNPSAFKRLNLFAVFNIPLFALLILSYANEHTISYDKLSLSAFTIFGVVHAAFLTWIFLVALPVIMNLLSLKRISKQSWGIFFATLCCFLLLIDRNVFLLYRTHINWTLVQMILSPARAEIFDMSISEYALAALALVIILSFEIGIAWYVSKLSRKSKWTKLSIPVYAMMFILLIGVQVTYAWADAVYEQAVLQVSELIPGFYGCTAKRYLEAHHWVVVTKRAQVISKESGTKLRYPVHMMEVSSLTQKPNILMIGIDAWRFDDFNEKTTPNMYKLSLESDKYLHHYSGGNSTRAGIFSLFYSVSPRDFDAFYKAGRGPVLFDVLYEQNYKVGVYTSASAVSPPFHRTTFVNVEGFRPNVPGTGSVERDKAITNLALDFIQTANKENQPYFSFVFYDSAHAYETPQTHFNPPFLPAAKLAHINLQGEEKKLLMHNQYRNALYYIDSLVGELLAELEKEGKLEDTLIILTSDHGEEFDDNGLGYWGHNGNFTPVQTHVPLIIHWPGQKQSQFYQHYTSHYDVIPTLFTKVLGVKNQLSDYSIGFVLEDDRAREIILMGSYGNTAMLFPALGFIAATNALGFFHMETLQGQRKPEESFNGHLFKLAFEQMNRFHAG